MQKHRLSHSCAHASVIRAHALLPVSSDNAVHVTAQATPSSYQVAAPPTPPHTCLTLTNDRYFSKARGELFIEAGTLKQKQQGAPLGKALDQCDNLHACRCWHSCACGAAVCQR